MKPGHAGTRTHDYRRNGPTCLLAALDVATGKAVGRTVERHRSEEFLAFLDHVAEGTAPGTPAPRCTSPSTTSRRTGRPRSTDG